MSGQPGQNLLLFLHSSIDHARLTPTGFSVFHHMAELADRSGNALIGGRIYYFVWDISSSDRNPGGAL
jgi:hypothetical protein